MLPSQNVQNESIIGDIFYNLLFCILLDNEWGSDCPVLKPRNHLCFFLLSLTLHLQKTSKLGGFPGGAVVENLPANAGDTGSEPWSGKIPHAEEQLGP